MMSFFNACRMIGFDRFGSRFGQGTRFDRMGFWGPGAMFVGLLVAILVIVGIFFLVRAIVRSSKKSPESTAASGNQYVIPPVAPTSASVSQAVQILGERLARGEIDTEEYRRRKDELLRP